jgi:hypothetical protein
MDQAEPSAAERRAPWASLGPDDHTESNDWRWRSGGRSSRLAARTIEFRQLCTGPDRVLVHGGMGASQNHMKLAAQLGYGLYCRDSLPAIWGRLIVPVVQPL